jgi:hypothetical protein
LLAAASAGRMGRMAASASNKEFARQFALVVVTPNDRLNDMVARSGYVAPLRRALVSVRPAGATGDGAHTQARGSAVLCVLLLVRGSRYSTAARAARDARRLALSPPSDRPWSLFSAMSECFPNFVKGDTLDTREGLQVSV